MTFEVVVPKDLLISDEELRDSFGGDIHKLAKWLYKEEGDWWGERMKLIKTEIINHDPL